MEHTSKKQNRKQEKLARLGRAGLVLILPPVETTICKVRN